MSSVEPVHRAPWPGARRAAARRRRRARRAPSRTVGVGEQRRRRRRRPCASSRAIASARSGLATGAPSQRGFDRDGSPRRRRGRRAASSTAASSRSDARPRRRASRVVGLVGRLLADRLEQARQQRAELELVEQHPHLLAVQRAHARARRARRRASTSRRSSDISRFRNTRSRASPRFWRCLGGSSSRCSKMPFEVPVGGDELGRGLLADAGDAGQVVARVAAQRRVLGVLRGRDAGALEDAGLVVERVVGDAALVVEHLDVRVGHELVAVAVAGDDHHVDAVGGGPRRERRDHVVGLDARDLQRRDLQRVEHLVDQRDLRHEEVGRLLAAALVVGVELVAEVLARARRTPPRCRRAARRRAPSRASR